MNASADQKQSLTKRLRRIEGQVRGVARMVDEEQYCIDVLTQINAVRSALDKVALELVRDHAAECLAGGVGDTDAIQAKSTELVTAMSRLLSR